MTDARGPIRLRGGLKRYAWGSRTALADLLGRPSPAPEPEAELWFGSHRRADTRAETDEGTVDLRSLLRRDGRPELPWLVKILAAAEPLSVQLHPTAERAAAGFRGEEGRGIDPDAPERLFPDPCAKPEVVVALTDFQALSGLRSPDAIEADLSRLELGLPPDARSALRNGDPRPLLRHLLAPSAADRSGIVDLLRRIGASPSGALERSIADLARRHPDDTAALAPLFLHHVRLRPGEALWSGAGVLHSYLEGVGVEVMGPSDNVLRAGLTDKAVDVDELLAALAPENGPPVPLRASRGLHGEYPLPGAPFRVAVRRGALGPTGLGDSRPRLLLVTAGRYDVEADGRRTTVDPGAAALLLDPPSAARIEGSGEIFEVW